MFLLCLADQFIHGSIEICLVIWSIVGVKIERAIRLMGAKVTPRASRVRETSPTSSGGYSVKEKIVRAVRL